MRTEKVKPITLNSQLIYSTDRFGNSIYQLDPTIIVNFPKNNYKILVKPYKTKIKGQIEDYKFESKNGVVRLPEKFRSLRVSQILDIPYIHIVDGESELFHENYRFVVKPVLKNLVSVTIYLKSIPETYADERLVEYLTSFKASLCKRPLEISQLSDGEDEKNYLPFVMLHIRAKTITEICKVADIFLTEVENETRTQLNH